jgi:glutathionylspermidine synthase
MTAPIDLDFNTALEADPAKAIAAWERVKARMTERGVSFGEKALPASLKPHFVPKSQHRRWIDTAEGLIRAVGELGRVLLEDEDLFSKVRFPAGARRLLDIDPGYSRIIVSCRPDFAWGPNGILAYEVNADSPAMMTFSDFLQDILLENHPLDGIARKYSLTFFKRTERMLQATLEVYREWGGTKSDPTIAIIDWSGQKTAYEQAATAAYFASRGCPAFTCDPRELSIERGKLVAQGRVIDIVQRRVLFPDFLSRATELSVLLRAYCERLVCLVNPLRSYIAGNKVLLALLHDADVRKRLSLAAQQISADSVPRTRVVDDEIRRELAGRRAVSVLKGAFSYGGHEVVIGRAAAEGDWERAVEATRQGQWIVQDYVPPPVHMIPRLEGAERVEWDELYANWNPFIFGDKFAGAMTRLSASLLVSITARGALLPSIEYDD